MAKTWEQLIAEGQELKIMEERVEAEAGNVRWLWGDLALEVAPMGANGEHTGATDRLRKYADEIDVSFESLRQYRNVADKWPAGMRVPAQPWVVHQQILGREDREELIANPVDVRTGERTERWTYRNMQRFLGRKPSPHYAAPPSTTEEKVEVAKDLLEDPEVRVEVMRSLAAEDRNAIGSGQPERSLDERWAGWVHQFNTLLMTAARLAEETEQTRAAGGHSQLALGIYRNLVERELDRELRRIMEEA